MKSVKIILSIMIVVMLLLVAFTTIFADWTNIEHNWYYKVIVILCSANAVVLTKELYTLYLYEDEEETPITKKGV